MAEGQVQAKDGGAGLPVREALLPASSRPPALGIYLGFTGLKSSLPTDVQKAKALMAASALASPVRSSPGSLPWLPVPTVTLCETVPCYQMPDVWLSVCLYPLPPDFTFRHGLNLSLLL